MRHRVAGRHLKRSTAHRRALYGNLIAELLRHERIRTTEAKAKAIRPGAEKLITLARRGVMRRAEGDHDVHERRLATARLRDPIVVRKLFDEVAPRYENRPGGYTRVLKLGPRRGDGAEMVLLELVE